MRISSTLAAGTLLAALALGACSASPPAPEGVVAPNPSTPAPAGLDAEGLAAWDRWRALDSDDYSYRLTVRCFCPSINGKRVVVEDGHVVSVGNSPYDATQVLTGFGHTEPTIDNLFGLLGGGQGGADEVTVSFDETTGIPTNTYVDYASNGVDDEVAYAVDSFTPTVTE